MNELFVNLIIFLPLLGAVGCLLPRDNPALSRMIAMVTAVVVLLINVALAWSFYGEAGGTSYLPSGGESVVRYVTDLVWIESVNIHYLVGVDGLSMPLLLLTSILNVLIIAAGWNVEKHAKAFMSLYLVLMFGMYGVFLALDFFLFYVFFEVSLLPMYFLIGIWGGPRKEYAAIKFFIYTLVGSICLLMVMLGFYFLVPDVATGAAAAGGKPSFNMIALAADEGVQQAFNHGGQFWTYAKWFFILLFISFAIKVPAVPFHTWLPDAHVEAPTPISMILAGVLLKMGGYALMRISYPIFPDAAKWAWFGVAIVGVVSIVYGAFCAMAQTDWKKLVAYSSVSHMGYVILGLAVLTAAGRNGAYFQMIGHGISSAMMFFLVGVVYERAHHRDLNRFGGLWNTMPAYTGLAAVGFFAGLGLPLLCGFPGEVLSLMGTFGAIEWIENAPSWVPFSGAGSSATVITLGVFAASGVILTAGYILWMFQRVYMGPARPEYTYSGRDMVNGREYFVMAVLALFAIILGVWPAVVLDMISNTFNAIYAPFSSLASAAGF